jgi:hypothetical protein
MKYSFSFSHVCLVFPNAELVSKPQHKKTTLFPWICYYRQRSRRRFSLEVRVQYWKYSDSLIQFTKPPNTPIYGPIFGALCFIIVPSNCLSYMVHRKALFPLYLYLNVCHYKLFQKR